MRNSLIFCLGAVSLLLLAGEFSACRKHNTPPPPKQPPTQLTVYALQEMRDNGFEAAVLKEFAKQNNTKLTLQLFPNTAELLAAVADTLKTRPDVVLGIDSAFALSDSLLAPFSPLTEINFENQHSDIPRDPSRRLIPYAFANLCVLNNAKVVAEPPRSIGELQDSRFMSEIALCDPFKSGTGRAQVYWSLALFGESGFEQFWNSLRKNVHEVYPDRASALNALRKGECGLFLGFDSSPAWVAEQDAAETPIHSAMPAEGAFQFVESAAIPRGALQRETAIKFINYLISPSVQQLVMYKLGMLPANASAPLSGDWASLPWSVFTVNAKLAGLPLREHHASWLAAWEKSALLRSF